MGGRIPRTVGQADVGDVARGSESYVEQQPALPLRGLVRSVWVQQVAADSEPYLQKNIPTGGIEFRCVVGSDPVLVGPMTGHQVDLLAPRTTVVGLRFHPGAASSLLGLPASELVDLVVQLSDLWGASTGMLAEHINGAGTPDMALAALQRHIAQRLTKAPRADAVISEAVRRLMPWQSTAIGEVASALSLSESQLRRRCLATVGLAPKTLHRALRFQGFLALAQRRISHGGAPTDATLTELAAEAGFADEPHLSRECRRLTGVSPRVFLGETLHRCADGHDHAASYMPLLRALPRAA